MDLNKNNETANGPAAAHRAVLKGLVNTPRAAELSAAKIDKKLVHKKMEENVLISEPVALDREKGVYRARVIADLSHPFFFDHPLGHLPGILLLEAVRQFGTALSHLFYHAPFDSQFILHEISAKFTAQVPSDRITAIDGVVTDVVMKNQVLRKMTGTAYVCQNDRVLGVVASSWSIVPAKVMTRLDDKFR
jgi:3-hydroxymyristoyl/3-hydroxydecanoyl-(acyl carrier protein) dehydratase